jgi:hypothetical protein
MHLNGMQTRVAASPLRPDALSARLAGRGRRMGQAPKLLERPAQKP